MMDKLLTKRGIVFTFIGMAVLSTGLTALVIWVIAHFIRKAW